MRSASLRAGMLALALLAPCVQAPGAEYVAVPAGSFISALSGGASASAPVAVARFALRATPVTNGEFIAFTDQHPDWRRGAAPSVFVDDNYLHRLDPITPDVAVTSVSWFAAQAFCESEGARLPTWYEWEYVAASDAARKDARRDPAWRAAILSWYSQASGADRQTVGGPPDFYGIRNMHGLIWEWVDDFNALLVSADSRSQGDPDKLQYCGAGAISFQDRENYAILMRVALLSSLSGADGTDNLGFRCARPQPKEQK